MPVQSHMHGCHASALHALDHLVRLYHRCQHAERIDTITADTTLSEIGKALASSLAALPADELTPRDEENLDRLRGEQRDRRRSYRESKIAEAPAGPADVDEIMKRLDGMRWLHRVAYHAWRIVHHLRLAAGGIADAPVDNDAALEAAED